MDTQFNKPEHIYHWHNQDSLDELEFVLDSNYLPYLDPNLVASMKRIIQQNRQNKELLNH